MLSSLIHLGEKPIGNHSVSFVVRLMECISVFMNLGVRPPCTGKRRGGTGSSHPRSWLEEAIDPRERH